MTITSSPGSTVAKIAAASASVAPLVTQTLLGVELETVMPAIMSGHRLAQRRQAARRRILVRSFDERPRRRVEDFGAASRNRETPAPG